MVKYRAIEEAMSLGTLAAADHPQFRDYTGTEAAPTAQAILAELAKNPNMDEFFFRKPPLSRTEQIAMFKKLRAERATWGER